MKPKPRLKALLATRRYLVVLAALAVVGLLVTSGAPAARPRPTVAIRVIVHGNGAVSLAVADARFGCHFGTSTCTHTFHVGRGRRVELAATPAVAWKLTRWGDACKGTAATCSLGRVTARRTVQVTFAEPGTRLNPYPLGKAVGIAPGWKLTVNSATLDADAQVEVVKGNSLPAPGTQYTLVNLTMKYIGGVSANLGDFLRQQMPAQGADNFRYNADACEPPQPDLGALGQVNLGQSETGNLCYAIEQNDASTLALSGWQGVGGSVGEHQVWIALH
jgi:hypothetical protein